MKRLNHQIKKSLNEELSTLSREENYELADIMTNIEKELINIKRSVFEIGRFLAKAKNIMPHGTFQLWIEKHFNKELPYSTAAAYLKVYNKFHSHPIRIQMMPLTFLLSMTQDKFPEAIVELFNENAEYCDKLDLKTVRDAYQMYKTGDINLSKFEEVAREQIQMGIDMATGTTRKRLSTNIRKTLSYGTQDILNAIAKVRKYAHQMGGTFPVVENNKDEELLLEQIDSMIREFRMLKKDLKSRKGLFRPVINANPIVGVEYISNVENSNN